MTLEKIKTTVLAKIKPTKTEEEKVRGFVSELMRVAKTITGLDCVIVGSIGKQTWLRGDHDIDLFVMFPKDTSRESLESSGLEFGKRIIKELRGRYEIKYSEHPYVHGYVKDYVVDVVPCYRIAKGEKIISAVDRSPLHLEHILMNLKHHDEVRLLKQFCKGAGIYGSDVVMQGISGYICELLILRYGTFEATLKAAKDWQSGVVLSLGGEPQASDRKKFYNQPLVFIDPIDPNRNVAANLSSENFVRFVLAAKNFLKKPNESFFWYQEPKPLTTKQLNALKARDTSFITLQMKKLNVMDDILYPQLRKALKRIDTLLRHNDFVALRSFEYVGGNEVFLVFELQANTLSNIKKMVGPPIFARKHSREFLEKYKNALYGPYLEGEYWVIEKKRDFVTAQTLLKSLTKKAQKDLESLGIPNNIAKSMKKAKITDGLVAAKKNKGFSAELNKKYFERLR